MVPMRVARMVLVVLAVGCVLRGQASASGSPAPPSLEIAAGAPGLRIDWRGEVGGAAWPLVEIGSARVPARLIAVRLTSDAPVAVRIGVVESRDWPGAIDAIPAAIPQTIGGPPRPDLRPAI